MNQLPLMIIVATMAGAFAAVTTWIAPDFCTLLARWYAGRREQRRLRAEAAAIKQAGADGKNDG